MDSISVQLAVKSPRNVDFEDLIKTICHDIFGYSDLRIMVFNNHKLLKKLSKDDFELLALLDNPAPHIYNIMVNTDNPSRDVICHELIHLDQYERGDLSRSKDYKTITWKGEEFTKDLDYSDREWEHEAFGNSRKLWKQYKKIKEERE